MVETSIDGYHIPTGTWLHVFPVVTPPGDDEPALLEARDACPLAAITVLRDGAPVGWRTQTRSATIAFVRSTSRCGAIAKTSRGVPAAPHTSSRSSSVRSSHRGTWPTRATGGVPPMA